MRRNCRTGRNLCWWARAAALCHFTLVTLRFVALNPPEPLLTCGCLDSFREGVFSCQVLAAMWHLYQFILSERQHHADELLV
eukprot:5108560-Amphidinium_carterae.1